MKLFDICIKEVSFEDRSAGWYVHNSIYFKDIHPHWRGPGGGVTFDELTDLPTALDKAISYTKVHIRKAEKHLKKLEAAKKEFNSMSDNERMRLISGKAL